MLNSESLFRVIIPVVLIYIIYSQLGPIGGIAALLIYALTYLFFNRSIIYQNKAGKKYHNGDYEGALSDLKTAVSSDPKNAKIRSTYAFLLVKMGYVDEAAAQIDEAISRVKLENDKNNMIVTKALVLWKQGNIDQAIDLLDELIKTFETTSLYSILGLLYIEKGAYTKALEFNLSAKDYNISNPVILNNLGASYFLLGDYDNAFETFQEVMKYKPAFPEAYYYYAKILEQKGDLEKALYMVRHSINLQFWHTSVVSKEKVESYLSELEAKEKEIENQKNAAE